MTESNAERFLEAFADIEEKLAQQQNRRKSEQQQKRRNFGDDWVPFWKLLEESTTLLKSHKDRLRQYAKLRNSIVHVKRSEGVPIADPREDVVRDIEKIRNLLLKPPRLVEALSGHEPPQVFEMDDSINAFLSLVVERSYSQAPVRDGGSYRLVTTNAVARYLAPSLIEDDIVETATIREVLEFAEDGDRLETLSPTATVLEAINLFSGETSTRVEPPSALLVLGTRQKSAPQLLCSRADLSTLYAQLNI
ncbi:hypothetical protein [Flaviflexus massiliensis]|uniref:hypothetical protein n=1 Tax=Flaviflexus massiliensis TaxID=1522309 RepID=UPI0006D53F2E|nr:hypothetical protein [Flaviflexus massiliensis]